MASRRRLIQLAEITQKRGRIGAAGTQFFFHYFQVAPDKSQIKHISYQFIRWSSS